MGPTPEERGREHSGLAPVVPLWIHAAALFCSACDPGANPGSGQGLQNIPNWRGRFNFEHSTRVNENVRTCSTLDSPLVTTETKVCAAPKQSTHTLLHAC